MHEPVFVLIDCNNFFASCERVFQPHLKEVPLAVLSNNDGCVIARSNRVKKLGVPMGAPLFKYAAMFKEHNVAVLSANFTLYGDMSQRVSHVLSEVSPRIELYSIDEAFLEIGDLHIDNYELWAQDLAASVERQVGIPVSVGIGSSKTLAKIATEYAKKHQETKGGVSLMADSQHSESVRAALYAQVLGTTKLGDVWGIGRRLGPKLERFGLRSALDVSNLRDGWALEQLTVVGLRTVKELQGLSCIPLTELNDEIDRQKMLSVTRSFSASVRSPHQLETAVATFAARAATRLRRKQQLSWKVTTFLQTPRHAKIQNYVQASSTLSVPSADTGEIIRHAHAALKAAHDSEFSYKKAGVILSGLVERSDQQLNLLEKPQPEYFSRSDALMTALDDLNSRYEQRLVRHGAEGIVPKEKWHSKREHKSPAFTTDWHQLPHARAL